MNEIIFLPIGELSEEAKARHKKRMEKRDERLRQMAEDAKNGKFDHLINSL